MDNCVVCCEFNEDVFSRISTVSSEWREWNIQHVIEKHLWWWFLRQPSNNTTVQWICRQCWQELSSFHNFYLRVESNHKRYELITPVIKFDKDDGEAITIKKEVQNFDNEPLFTESLMDLGRPKKGRRKITCNNPESMQIEELPFIEVKNEMEANDNLEVLKSEINMLATDSVDDSESCLTYQNESDETKEGYKLEDVENENIHILQPKNVKVINSQLKAKIVKKCKRKYTKSKKQKKTKDLEKKDKSGVSQAIKKSDEFIANNNFELSCNICNDTLDDFYKLKMHYRKKHDILGYVMCCNRKFYKRGVLVDHLNVHKDPNYFKCLQCNKALSTRRSYEKHIETHQLSAEPRQNLFACDKCDKSFLKKAVFDRHILTHIPEDERNFQCSICSKKFASEYLRRQHISLTHTNKYAKICDICGKLFRDSFSFIRHMGEHNGEPPIKVPCEICGAELSSKYRLNRHKKLMHTEENQQEQICPYCSKVSPNLNAHRHHVKYTHTLERKHACHMCEKKFRRPLELKEHLSTHTGEPLYTCPHCPRTFISGANMHKHRKLSHRKEWEEARLKKNPAKQQKLFASKKIFNNFVESNNEPAYLEISKLDSSETVSNLTDLNFKGFDV